MKNLLVGAILLMSIGVFAQNNSECVAVFHEDDMVADEFSPRGISIVSKYTKGSLTVNLVTIGDEIIKGAAVSFYVAIKDVKTKTLTMISAVATQSLDLQSITSNRKEGDKIVIIMSDSRYALPTEQHEIMIID